MKALDRSKVVVGKTVAEWRKGEFKPGATVYTSLESVSRSGLTRSLRCYQARRDRIVDVTYVVAKLTGRSTDKNGNILMQGCGMDMGFSLVYDLSYTLYKGTCFKCAKNGRAGYALEHRWL